MTSRQFVRVTALGLLFLASISGASLAHAAEGEIEALKAEIARLSERLSALEAQQSAHAAAVTPAPEPRASKSKGKPGIGIKGDFRYRYEAIDEDGSTDRHRNRMRARVGLSGQVNETIKAGIGLASGGDSPTSTNQTLDDGFSTKDFGLDLAYVTWQAAPGAQVTAGKMKNPLYRVGGNQLLWDGDLNPEGLALELSREQLFVNVAAFYVEERSGSDDSFLFGAQLGFDTDFDSGLSLRTGLGYYGYTNTVGNAPFYDGDPLGNAVDAGGNLVNDYRQVELFAELGAALGELPVKVFADWVQNTEASNFDTAYAIGLKLGKASAPGSWDFGWVYQDVEADAVIATFSNSDFGGGGTDATGHIFTGKYVIAKNWTAGFTYFLNEIGDNVGNPRDYQRLQADLQFKF